MNNKDFSKYQSIIERFRGTVVQKDFEAKFAEATLKIPTSERFLLKMEIKRLGSSCTRLIDLRGLVNGECRAYEHEGRVHFLDDVAIKTFEQNLAYYGAYTFGVYDATTNTENNFRVIYQKEKASLQGNTNTSTVKSITTIDKIQYPAKFYTTRVYHDRCEERMNYSVPILVMLNEQTVIEALSSDMSGKGFKLKFTEHQPFYLDQVVTLRLTGLERDFQFGENHSFSYKVRNISVLDKLQYVGFERVDIVEKDTFLQFLTGYIQGNKRRYKINLENTVEALQCRSFEQFVVPKINELPVFLGKNDEQLVPKYVLTCANNQPIYQYWQNETGQQTLSLLLNHERASRVKKAAKVGGSLLVYCFNHQSHDKLYFYTADEQQLQKDRQFFSQFVAFAAVKPSFKIFSLRYQSILTERGFAPFTVANTLKLKDLHLNQTPTDEVKQILASLAGIITITDITSDALIADYRSLSYDNINMQLLKDFGHKYPTKLPLVDEVGLNYRNHRQEPRFIFETPTVLTLKQEQSSGVSEDFSVSGLRVKFDQATNFEMGDVLQVTFPKLQQITSAFELKGLPYEIVRMNKSKTVLNMKVYVEQHQHVGRSFFKALIEKNRDKLKSDEYALLIPGLSKALRTVYSRSLLIANLLIQSSGSRYKTEVIVASEQSSPLFSEMQRLSDRDNFYNLFPLLSALSNSTLADSQLKKMFPKDSPVSEELYIAINPNKELVENKVLVRLGKDLALPEMKKMFIKRAIKNGHFFCVKLVMSRTEPPDMGYLNPELSYISTYAIHRAKQLEQEIWSVSGVMQCIDITDEAMNRYQLL